MRKVFRVLFTKPCLGCADGIVSVTTQTPTHQRPTRRFCTKQCANKHMNLVHGTEWAHAMQVASMAVRKAKAYASAKALLGTQTTPETARVIYDRGYQAGYAAGKKTGLEHGEARTVRAYKRAYLARRKLKGAA